MHSIAEDIEWTIANVRGKDKDGKFIFGPGPKMVEGGWTI